MCYMPNHRKNNRTIHSEFQSNHGITNIPMYWGNDTDIVAKGIVCKEILYQ